jgi:hypothetical protein
MSFCKNCNNLLDISKTQPKQLQDKKPVAESTSLNKAYYVCSNCLYSCAIEPCALISSKASNNISKYYVNSEKFQNYIYNPALPRTRNYICVNKECESHKDHNLREAVFYRQCVNNLQIWYTCCACKNYWKG